MRAFPAAVLCLALASCSGTQTQLRVLEQQGALRVDAAGPDYVVSIRNVRDVGYDMDNPETRHDAAIRALATQCPQGRVIGENTIETGTYLIGIPSRTYAIRVRC